MTCTKKFKTWVNASTTLACTDTALTLTGATCAEISNCEQTLCYDGTTDTVACGVCKKNYYGSTWEAVNGSGSAACTATPTITNCEQQFQSSATVNKCYTCKSNFAVANDELSCVAYTTDSNCRSLQTGNAACRNCWHAYYWNATVCKLAAKILAVGLLALAALF